MPLYGRKIDDNRNPEFKVTIYLSLKKIYHFPVDVDHIFAEDDFNKDGYLDYTEYVSARRRHEKESDMTLTVDPEDFPDRMPHH